MKLRELAFGVAPFALALLVLAGCASTTADLSPQQRVYAMQQEFDATLTEVEAYAALPECTDATVTACAEPEVVDAMLEAATEADAALDDAEEIVRAGGDSYAVYINAARAALNRIALMLVEDAR